MLPETQDTGNHIAQIQQADQKYGHILFFHTTDLPPEID